MITDLIMIRGAREHNLKNINVDLPRNKFIVITGVSGSGKSSLAFDTIYAEGQRRYVESLSAYARQFLGQMEKPDIDYIAGLSPAISIEQKTTHRNPRSTVGTVTEIYDYLRLLFARCGQPYCPNCGVLVEKQSIDQIVSSILKFGDGTKLQILSPIVRDRKGSFKKELGEAKRSGFVRLRVDGELYSTDDKLDLDKNKRHNIDIIVDRIVIGSGIRERVVDSVETALSLSEGIVLILYDTGSDSGEKFFSEHLACISCDISLPVLEPRTFSFNSPEGACSSCHGIGEKLEFSRDLIIPDGSLSIMEGALAPIRNIVSSRWYSLQFEGLASFYGFSLDTPIDNLDEDVVAIILHGTGDEKLPFVYVSKDGSREYRRKTSYEGIIPMLSRRYKESGSDYAKDFYERFMKSLPCDECGGKRLRKEVLSVRVDSKSIIELTELSIVGLISFLKSLNLGGQVAAIAERILKEILDRLIFLNNVGLSYLSLSRKAGTLSGGEMQRIRLATQIGSGLVGVLYVLDEPSIGLHQRDNKKLIETLLRLRDLGNTLVVVEHDEATIRKADYVLDLGPGAGIDGGYISAMGSVSDIINNPSSLTGQYLTHQKTIDIKGVQRSNNNKQIIIRECDNNNLKGIDVIFPLSRFIVVTGVSGSGKSTLINATLYPALMSKVYSRSKMTALGFREIVGVEELDKVIAIDQSPIGRTPRSNPATYTGLFTPIRELFSMLKSSKQKGYKAGRFSFNVKGGRCEACRGDGTIKIEMHFLADIYIKCEVCSGKRYNKETLEIRYKGKNIAEVLDLTIEQAVIFFENIPKIHRKLKTLYEVGLGYVKLGQSATTLSGGEAQRVKLSAELSKRYTGKTFYLLDEPTTGLHFDDVNKLVAVLDKLVSKGNTVVVIEHNLDLIKLADYIIDLGPEGGDEGGYLVASGSPEEVMKVEGSYTGKCLAEMLSQKVDMSLIKSASAQAMNTKSGATLS